MIHTDVRMGGDSNDCAAASHCVERGPRGGLQWRGPLFSLIRNREDRPCPSTFRPCRAADSWPVRWPPAPDLSSTASRLGAPGRYVHYAASKGAIDSFTLGLAQEVAAEGVRVNAVRPGIVDTDIHASAGQPDRARAAAPQIPMQRAGTAAEIAEAIGWLLSDAARYTTGALLDVAGGR